MKIAQIAPLAEAVPPKLYGGTERIVSYLTEELVRRGHEVTLFASQDSETSADLVPCSPSALRLSTAIRDPVPYCVCMLEQVRRRAAEFDVLHFHIDLLHYLLIRDFADRTVTTLHGRLDLDEYTTAHAMFPELPFVSISDDQRRPLPSSNWIGTVYHGLPRDLLPFNPSPAGGYLAFLGRISPEKRPDRAIEIAALTGLPLKIAAKIDKGDLAYWREVIQPMIAAHPNVEFVGEITERQKAGFLGNALALLFPIDWPEPFGLVMIEAMSCGTPVLAFPCGSVPEIIEPGKSGFIVESIEQAVRLLPAMTALDRRIVRARFEERFSVERMVDDYLTIYSSLARLDARARQIAPNLKVVA